MLSEHLIPNPFTTDGNSGDNVVLPAPPAYQRLRIGRVVLYPAAGQTLAGTYAYKFGDQKVTGDMSMDGLISVYDEFPHCPFVLPAGTAFILNLSTAQVVTGYIQAAVEPAQ